MDSDATETTMTTMTTKSRFDELWAKFERDEATQAERTELLQMQHDYWERKMDATQQESDW